MHLFPFTSHLRGLDRAPHVKQEYQNAKKEEGGGERSVQQKTVLAKSPTFRTLFNLSSLSSFKIILHGLFVSAPVGARHAIQTPFY